jgi:hypothetical protein
VGYSLSLVHCNATTSYSLSLSLSLSLIEFYKNIVSRMARINSRLCKTSQSKWTLLKYAKSKTLGLKKSQCSARIKTKLMKKLERWKLTANPMVPNPNTATVELGWTFAIFQADPTPVSITFRVSIIQFFPLYLNLLLTKPLLEVILVFKKQFYLGFPFYKFNSKTGGFSLLTRVFGLWHI